MLQQAPPATAVLAVCLSHGQFWILSEDRLNCLVCGGPPSHALALPVYGEVSAPVGPSSAGAEAPPEEPITINVKCPHCDGDVSLVVTEEAISVAQPQTLQPAEEAAGVLGGETPAAPPPAAEELSGPPSAGEPVEGIDMRAPESSSPAPQEPAS